MKKKSFLRHNAFRGGLKCFSILLVLSLFSITTNASHYSPTSENGAFDTESQQSRKVTGKVYDASGATLPGVSVVVKGSALGTITSIDGDFALEVPADAKTLLLTFVGMQNVELDLANQTSFKVIMEESSIGLDELIVVGYGAQKKATLTGSVTQVKGDEVMKGKGTSSAALALQGEVPGVVVTRSSSRPGNEGIDIKIRGDISVNNISPTIIVDGMEIPEWQLSTLNANDIETYSVLKDGAAAIYGTKAAGGVILITTKKGKKGKMKVEVSSDYQMNFTKSLPITNLQEWGQMWLEAGDNQAVAYVDADGNDQVGGYGHKFFDRDEFIDIANGELPDVKLFNVFDFHYADTDYNAEIFGTTLSHRHNVSISGGSENATYRTSIGYADERSAMDFTYDGAKKYNFRTNVTYDISDMLSTDFNVSYDNRLINEPTQGVGATLQDPWLFPLYNPDGQYYHLWGKNNILAKLDEGGRTKTKQEIFRLGGSVKLDLDKYVSGLSFKYTGNVSSRSSDKTSRTTTVTVWDWEGNASITNPTLAGTSVKEEISKVLFQNHVLQANYKRSFENHNLGVMLAATAEQTDNDKYTMYRSNMASDDLDDINTGDVTTQTNSGGSSAVGLVSYLGKVNYDYNGVYLFEVSGRRDGSSRLDPDYRWKNFYYSSAGIRFSEMDFVKDLGFFDNLKLRVSYGETGSTTGIGSYDYISTIKNGSAYFGASPAVANTSYVSSMTSTDRTWERVANTNYAIDFATFNNRLSGTVEYFHRENKDMLISVTYPQVLGATAPKTNSGDFDSNGWELSLNWRDQVGDFKYRVGLALWDTKSEVTRMEGATTIKAGTNTSAIEGKPLNAIYTYKTNGLFQNEGEVLAYYNNYGFVDPSDQLDMRSGTLLPDYRSAKRLTPGCVNRVDANEDGVINTDDLVYYGDANPHFSFGINLGLEWKGFDFSAFFQGVAKQNIVRTGGLSSPFKAWYMGQNSTFNGKTWSATNTGAEFPMMFGKGDKRNTWNYQDTNDINVIKASYMRAKVITLGYTLPKSLVKKAGLERLRVSATGNDLFVISNVKDGLDPEMATSAHNGDMYPYNSSLLFSIEATF